ncbi:hypothetical protein EDD16DRAFT_1534544, partial [Pisolithus croceorrhizus]
GLSGLRTDPLGCALSVRTTLMASAKSASSTCARTLLYVRQRQLTQIRVTDRIQTESCPHCLNRHLARLLRRCQRYPPQISISPSRSSPYSGSPVALTRASRPCKRGQVTVLKLTQENEKLKEELRAMTARLEAAERKRRELDDRKQKPHHPVQQVII